jgi:kumamolisin
MVHVTVTLRSPDLPDADHLPSKGMSYKDFESQYGASKADADKVEQVLGGYGLKSEDVCLGTSSMKFKGTVKEMEAAFGTKLSVYHNDDQGEFRGRDGAHALQIPADLDGVVTGVFGLDQRRVAKRSPAAAPAARALAPVTPSDLENIYNFPPGDGSGQTIGIAEFGGGYFPSDLTAFCNKFGLTVPNVQVVPINLQSLTIQQIQSMPQDQQQISLDYSTEVNMDVQIVAGLCPGANIAVYFATFDQQGWVGMLNQVIQDKPVTLSVSYGLAEDSSDWSAAALKEINKRLNAASMMGITVCVSSGDDGSGCDEHDGSAHVEFPTASPFVLSVGGTQRTGSSRGHISEVVWWESPGERVPGVGGGATGGGVSTKFPRASWQNVNVPSVNSIGFDGRVLPDVTALAGQPLYDLIFLGQDAPNGGTSASTPVWAALIARINAALPSSKQTRFFTKLLYQPGPNGTVPGQVGFNDITSGNNITKPNPGIGYNAGPGYDAASGWGTPDGVKLLNSL